MGETTYFENCVKVAWYLASSVVSRQSFHGTFTYPRELVALLFRNFLEYVPERRGHAAYKSHLPTVAIRGKVAAEESTEVICHQRFQQRLVRPCALE